MSFSTSTTHKTTPIPGQDVELTLYSIRTVPIASPPKHSETKVETKTSFSEEKIPAVPTTTSAVLSTTPEDTKQESKEAKATPHKPLDITDEEEKVEETVSDPFGRIFKAANKPPEPDRAQLDILQRELVSLDPHRVVADTKGNKRLQTPASSLVSQGNAQAALFLVAYYGANPDLVVREAARQDDVNLTRMLIEIYGADPDRAHEGAAGRVHPGMQVYLSRFPKTDNTMKNIARGIMSQGVLSADDYRKSFETICKQHGIKNSFSHKENLFIFAFESVCEWAESCDEPAYKCIAPLITQDLRKLNLGLIIAASAGNFPLLRALIKTIPDGYLFGPQVAEVLIIDDTYVETPKAIAYPLFASILYGLAFGGHQVALQGLIKTLNKNINWNDQSPKTMKPLAYSILEASIEGGHFNIFQDICSTFYLDTPSFYYRASTDLEGIIDVTIKRALSSWQLSILARVLPDPRKSCCPALGLTYYSRHIQKILTGEISKLCSKDTFFNKTRCMRLFSRLPESWHPYIINSMSFQKLIAQEKHADIRDTFEIINRGHLEPDSYVGQWENLCLFTLLNLNLTSLPTTLYPLIMCYAVDAHQMKILGSSDRNKVPCLYAAERFFQLARECKGLFSKGERDIAYKAAQDCLDAATCYEYNENDYSDDDEDLLPIEHLREELDVLCHSKKTKVATEAQGLFLLFQPVTTTREASTVSPATLSKTS